MRKKLLLIFLFSMPLQTFAVDCNTNCKNQCRVRLPMGGHFTEPVCYTSCESTRVIACEVFEKAKNGIISNLTSAIADDPQVTGASRGWTIWTCASAGASLFYAIQAGYSAPVCAAFNAAAAGCVAFILSSGGLITTGTCATLCDRHRLSGSECEKK